MDFQNWHFEINTLTSLHFYSQIKDDFYVENYLSCLEKPIHKILLINARLGIIRLESERGKWYNIPQNDRICRACDTGEVEDIYHSILKCSTYNSDRNRLLPESVPNLYYLIFLFRSKNPRTISLLSQFIYCAYQIRQTVLPPGEYQCLL